MTYFHEAVIQLLELVFGTCAVNFIPTIFFFNHNSIVAFHFEGS